MSTVFCYVFSVITSLVASVTVALDVSYGFGVLGFVLGFVYGLRLGIPDARACASLRTPSASAAPATLGLIVGVFGVEGFSLGHSLGCPWRHSWLHPRALGRPCMLSQTRIALRVSARIRHREGRAGLVRSSPPALSPDSWVQKN
jgi:hypothetical protein